MALSPCEHRSGVCPKRGLHLMSAHNNTLEVFQADKANKTNPRKLSHQHHLCYDCDSGSENQEPRCWSQVQELQGSQVLDEQVEEEDEADDHGDVPRQGPNGELDEVEQADHHHPALANLESQHSHQPGPSRDDHLHQE